MRVPVALFAVFVVCHPALLAAETRATDEDLCTNDHIRALEATEAAREALTSACTGMLTSPGLSKQSRRDTYDIRGRSYMLRQDYALALHDFEAAIRLEPDSPDSLLNRAAALVRLGQLKQAEDQIDDVLSRPRLLSVEGFVVAYTNRARIYLKTDRYDKSIADFSAAIERDPTNDKHYRMRALLYTIIGDKARATADMQEAHRLEVAQPR